uniref:AGC-kinase C-terminal domain-containing protein n=1 Tax=Mesocestoides corti TaxID=53468 RepID=A0A5K3FYX5_MESCO
MTFRFDVKHFPFRFQMVFLDADCRPLFVTGQPGLLEASEFDAAMSKRVQAQQTRRTPGEADNHPGPSTALHDLHSFQPIVDAEAFDWRPDDDSGSGSPWI